MSQQPPSHPQTTPMRHPRRTCPQSTNGAVSRGPGVGLIVAGALSMISSIGFVIWAMLMMVAAQSVGEATANIDMVDAKQEMSKADRQQLKKMGDSISTVGRGLGFGLIVGGALAFVVSCLIIYGGIQMTRASSYSFCVIAAVLAMLPTGCWLVTLPLGVWAIVILLDNNVKGEFA